MLFGLVFCVSSGNGAALAADREPSAYDFVSIAYVEQTEAWIWDPHLRARTLDGHAFSAGKLLPMGIFITAGAQRISDEFSETWEGPAWTTTQDSAVKLRDTRIGIGYVHGVTPHIDVFGQIEAMRSRRYFDVLGGESDNPGIIGPQPGRVSSRDTGNVIRSGIRYRPVENIDIHAAIERVRVFETDSGIDLGITWYVHGGLSVSARHFYRSDSKRTVAGIGYHF
jgi:hypothetical protein